MNSMLGRGRDDYLFSEGDLGNGLRAHLAKALEAVDAVPEQDFNASTDEQIADKIARDFSVTPLEILEADKRMDRSETKIDVSKYSDRNPFRDPGPIYTSGIRVVITIPFKGDAGLWKLRPGTWRTTFPRGEVHASRGADGGTLDLVFERPADEGGERIKQDLERQLDDIRFYIGNQRQQIANELAQLPRQVAEAIARRRQRLAKHDTLSDILGIPMVPKGSSQPLPKPVAVSPSRVVKASRRAAGRTEKWDVFISHASEDKEAIARPLAEEMQKVGFKVWFDEFSLTVGDSLRQSIEKGLASSRFGVVIISPHFLEKHWPQRELDGLAAREVDGEKVILPVWHNIDRQTLARHSPMLSDRYATNSEKGIAQVVIDLKTAINAH